MGLSNETAEERVKEKEDGTWRAAMSLKVIPSINRKYNMERNQDSPIFAYWVKDMVRRMLVSSRDQETQIWSSCWIASKLAVFHKSSCSAYKLARIIARKLFHEQEFLNSFSEESFGDIKSVEFRILLCSFVEDQAYRFELRNTERTVLFDQVVVKLGATELHLELSIGDSGLKDIQSCLQLTARAHFTAIEIERS